ncbi:MAG: hypothetical protein M3Z30_08675 [Gemmatimonadota bacterium]|nr:hypothetical protein [Gemmatimonadota bacterium]
MSLVAFDTLPDDARVWVFGSATEMSLDQEATLLSAIDEYLSGWRAHGSPLTVGRDWRDGRFLAIGIDQRDENASGCSLDALFRVLSGLEQRLGTALLGNSRVYFREPGGAIAVSDRAAFVNLARDGAVRTDTAVFDLSVQSAGEWRNRFETSAGRSWHNALLPNTA